jgi:hypothetical protein
MAAKTQTKSGSQKVVREFSVSDKDALIGMNLINTEKNELIRNIKKACLFLHLKRSKRNWRFRQTCWLLQSI